MIVYQNREWLYKKYVQEQLTPYTIASIAGCSRRTIGNWLVKLNIPLRDKSEARLLQGSRGSKYELLNDKQWLANKYAYEGLSTIEIAKLIGAKTNNSVRQFLKKHNIETRSRVQAQVHNRIDDGFVLNMPVINGCLLGDASLKKTNKTNAECWPHFHKKNIHYDHVLWVAKLLFAKNPEKRILKSGNFNKRTNKYYEYYLIRSLAQQELIGVFKKWYPESNNYRKVIPEDLKPSAELLLHWFLDDGMSYRRRKESKTKQIIITLCTDCFCRDQQENLCKKFKNKFGLMMKTTPYRNSWRIQIPQSQTPLFYEIIGPPPVKSLAYKWK